VVDPKSLGAFVGLSGVATAMDLLRAIIEGLDYQFRDIVTAMECALGANMERFVAVGGATRNAFWMQNKADVLGRPVEVPAIEEATPLGAAILAGIGLGLYRDEEDAYGRVYRPGKIYEPDAALAARYAEWFAIYRDLYPALAAVHHRVFERIRTS
jgi:xylulokinase